MEWLQPGIHADLVDGEKTMHSPVSLKHAELLKFAAYEEHGAKEYWMLDPEHLAHRFYRRDGELLVEFALGASRIHSANIPGFWVERAWLDPANLPAVSQCLEILHAAPV